TANVLDFNKQALLIVLVFVSLFAWMLKVLILGKANFNLSLVHIPLVALFLVYIASTIFSLWRYGSFWGWPQVNSESLLSLLGLILLYFLVTNIFEKKEIFYLMVSLVASSFLAMLYGLLQLFGKFLIPIGFTKAASFNTIGGVNGLAIFAAILLPLVIIFLTISKGKYLRVFSVVTIILLAVLLLLINFQTAWWLVIVGSALVIAFGTQKRDVFDNRWLVLPMFFLALALLFSFFRFQIPGTPDRPVEVFLTHRASFDIVWKTLKQNPVIGSGPGTFIYNFSKYKDIDFNQGNFWNLRFDWASSKMLTMLATTGILGILSFFALIGFFIFYGIKFLFTKKQEEGQDPYWGLGLGIFISFLTISTAYFFYRSNLSLDFVWFLLMASFVSLLSPIRKEVVLKASSLVTLGITFAFTLIFIFGLGILILEGQRYASAASYLKGMKDWQQEESIKAMEHFEDAARVSPGNDLYWRELSQVYLQTINEVSVRTDLSQQEITRQVQILINSAVNSSKIAIETNPQNVINWSTRGSVYQNLIGMVGGTKEWAVESYKRASELEPTNPFFPTQIGIVLLKEASLLTADGEKEEQNKLLVEAEGEFNKAIELKPDYAPAHFQLAMVYQAQGEGAEMIIQLERARTFAPYDVGLAFQLGLIYFQRQDYEKARLEFERAVLLNNDYANALYFLGLTYDELGESQLAIKTFERILVANPDHSLVISILNNLRAGEEALKGIVEEEPPIAPIEEED
ncbi:MAG TPA: tetratricopeptide repeat protein, partial [candidate division CPR3 bacterium]|nr:tetratricopeptide repeat protein [candidate division CPR3 bacterium]